MHPPPQHHTFRLRHTHGVTFCCSGLRASIWLLGYMPPKVRNYQNMFKPLVDMYRKLAPDKEGIEVFDAALGKNVRKWLVCAWLTNDVRGVPNATCGKAPPCLVGSCNMCTVGGHYHLATTVVPGAVWSLKPTHDGASRNIYTHNTCAFFSSVCRFSLHEWFSVHCPLFAFAYHFR